MSFSRQDKLVEQDKLVGRLCNDDLDADGRARLNESLSGDIAAQREYVREMDLQAMIRLHAQSLDDEDFALLETQAALDSVHAGELIRGCDANQFGGATDPRQRRAIRTLAWSAAAAVMLLAAAWMWPSGVEDRQTGAVGGTAAAEDVDGMKLIAAQLRGTVGALWAGDRLELPEGEKFLPGRRLELVEGLAEIYFNSDARVILQGPAIIDVCDPGRAVIAVGRAAVSVPEEAQAFCLETVAARLEGHAAEYGVEVEVDGSLATEVYDGEVDVRFGVNSKDSSTLKLAKNQAVEVDARTGHAAMIPEPTGLHFVRYLPRGEKRINLAEVVAGGVGNAFHRGISLVDGQVAEDYGPPALGDGQYKLTHSVDYVDGVFIPNGKLGPTQVDSIGRSFAFPGTAGDCWGGAVMARRPRYESSLPLIRLEFFGDNYGYVNWLHIAGDSDELTPAGLGLVGMHSNSGITFDLHAMRSRYPDRTIARFRALVGNLESKAEMPSDRHTAEAWVLVDGELRHHRRRFSRESGPEEINVPLSDRDRFLVLAVTDDGSTAYDWVAFGDAVIEMNEREVISLVPRRERQQSVVGLARWH